jgi:hypothetical protein
MLERERERREREEKAQSPKRYFQNSFIGK